MSEVESVSEMDYSKKGISTSNDGGQATLAAVVGHISSKFFLVLRFFSYILVLLLFPTGCKRSCEK